MSEGKSVNGLPLLDRWAWGGSRQAHQASLGAEAVRELTVRAHVSRAEQAAAQRLGLHTVLLWLGGRKRPAACRSSMQDQVAFGSHALAERCPDRRRPLV